MYPENFEILKLFKNPNYTFEVKLGDAVFTLELIENFVNNSVTLNVYNTEKEPILLGVKVVAGLNLFSGVTVSGIPKGSLFLLTRDLARDLVVGDDLDGVFLMYTTDFYEDFYYSIDYSAFVEAEVV